MESIRCAFVSSYMGPYYSNYVASVISFERAMQRKGYFSVYVFPKDVENYAWVDKLRAVNDKLFFMDYRPHSVNNFRELRRIIKENNINLIYSRMCGWDFTAHFAAPELPIIWHMEMRVIVDEPIRKIKNWLKFRILGFGKTYHIAVSQPVTDSINSLRPHNCCKFIPNALDLSRLVAKESIFDLSTKNILVFGYDPIVKGVDIALDACEIVNRDKVCVNLLISSQEKTYQYMRERYNKIPSWVELLPPTDNVSEIYNRADVLLSSSRSEGFPYGVAEALFSGLSVIYSSIPGTKWAGEFKSTYEFPTENATALADTIQHYLLHPITQDERESNKALLIQKYSIETWIQSVMDVIDGI